MSDMPQDHHELLSVLPGEAKNLTMEQVAYLFDNHSRTIILLMQYIERLLARVEACEQAIKILDVFLAEKFQVNEPATEEHKPGGYL